MVVSKKNMAKTRNWFERVMNVCFADSVIGAR